MWMLLEARAPRGASEDVAAPAAVALVAAATVPRNGMPRPVETLLAVIGASTGVDRHADDVGIFLHPGRSLVASVSLERLFDQFDCRPRDVFASLGEAEVAHAEDVGFLLEVRRPFTDNAGRRRDHGVLFARSVRT